MWKETEIGTIPNDWEVGLFNDDLKVQGRIGWKGYKTSDLVATGPYVVGGAEIKSKIFLDLKNAHCLSREKYDESPEIKLKDGDVLLATRGNLGDVGYYHSMYGEGTINPSVIILNNFKGDSKFLFYYLTSKQGNANVMSLAGGSSVPAIYQADVKQLKYPKPPYEEQKKISETAFSIDLKIDLLHRQNKTLEQLAETLFRQWFVEEAEESWEKTTFGELVKPRKGKNITKADAIEGDYPVVAGGLEPSCYHNQSNTSEPVITVSSSGANAGFVRMYYSSVWASDCSYIDNTITPFVFFSYVFLKINQEILFDKQEGSAQPHVYPSHIMEIEMLNYPKSKIKMFEEEVTPMFQKIKSNTNQIKTLQQLRDTLLPKLMSGEVRIEYSNNVDKN